MYLCYHGTARINADAALGDAKWLVNSMANILRMLPAMSNTHSGHISYN